jgi:hypothetical protein
MSAKQAKQIQNHLQNFLELAKQLVEAQNAMFQFREAEEVVGQNWNNLAADYPDMIDGSTQDDPVKLGDTAQPFSANDLKKFKNAVKQLDDAMQGEEVIITANLGRHIRTLTDGVV